MDTRLSPASFAYLFNCQKAERVKWRVGAESLARARSRVTVPGTPRWLQRCRSLASRIKQSQMHFFPLSQQMQSCEVGRQHNLSQQRLLVSAQPHRAGIHPSRGERSPGLLPKPNTRSAELAPLEKRIFLSWGARLTPGEAGAQRRTLCL